MTNRLATESSPYLRQHADNPVDWYPWSDEAFRRAREENRPILLSVGYAACHWCHVMAHESFENPRIASLMNERYVSIKVDRQERPDIDEIYQQVSQMMGQGGGWPLTVFLTPQGEPFFGGTYFPPDDRYGRPAFARVLIALSEAWRHRHDELRDTIVQIQQGFRQLDQAQQGGPTAAVEDLPAQTAHALTRDTDPAHGGLGGAPKFPNPSCYDLMLRVYERSREPSLFDALERTLDHMAAGGIYDQVGGGFARYSVDAHWAVPHFEKMLYDNGQLVKLYADAYRLTGKRTWRCIFEETLAYILRDMTHPEGGFYASEDADSEGQEGKFYCWMPAEIKAVLGESEGALACRAYGVTERGNFEHGATVLHRAVELDAREETQLAGWRERLLAARARRVRPARDDNILTGWNGLMIAGLCAAFQATGVPEYLGAAKRAAKFIGNELTLADGGVFRVWKDGVAKVPGFLEDYAFLCNALLDLYESCFDGRTSIVRSNLRPSFSTSSGRTGCISRRAIASPWCTGPVPNTAAPRRRGSHRAHLLSCVCMHSPGAISTRMESGVGPSVGVAGAAPDSRHTARPARAMNAGCPGQSGSPPADSTALPHCRSDNVCHTHNEDRSIRRRRPPARTNALPPGNLDRAGVRWVYRSILEAMAVRHD